MWHILRIFCTVPHIGARPCQDHPIGGCQLSYTRYFCFDLHLSGLTSVLSCHASDLKLCAPRFWYTFASFQEERCGIRRSSGSGATVEFIKCEVILKIPGQLAQLDSSWPNEIIARQQMKTHSSETGRVHPTCILWGLRVYVELLSTPGVAG